MNYSKQADSKCKICQGTGTPRRPPLGPCACVLESIGYSTVERYWDYQIKPIGAVRLVRGRHGCSWQMLRSDFLVDVVNMVRRMKMTAAEWTAFECFFMERMFWKQVRQDPRWRPHIAPIKGSHAKVSFLFAARNGALRRVGRAALENGMWPLRKYFNTLGEQDETPKT